MQESENQALYWDKHRIPVNITIIFSLGIAALGIFQMVRDSPGRGIPPQVLILLGLLFAAYSWLKTPKVYVIYPDALMVGYGRPRRKYIYFSDISEIDMRQGHSPDRLRVLKTNGRREAVVAKDPEAFHDQLQQALNAYRGQNTQISNGQSSDGSAEFYDNTGN